VSIQAAPTADVDADPDVFAWRELRFANAAVPRAVCVNGCTDTRETA
jgi:hypothetical protein